MPIFNHSTIAQLSDRLRERFKIATRLECLQIARVLATLTDAQLKNLFNLTTAQTTTLRAKLTDMLATIDKIRAAVGQ